MAKSMATVARRRRREREAMAGGGRLGTPSLAVFYDLFPQFFFLGVIRGVALFLNRAAGRCFELFNCCTTMEEWRTWF
jgi:hypothetical protein